MQCILNVFLDTSWNSNGYIPSYDHMDHVYCSGSEERLRECEFNIISDGTSNTGVRLTCQQSEHNYSNVIS